jgi:hypothetical protein
MILDSHEGRWLNSTERKSYRHKCMPMASYPSFICLIASILKQKQSQTPWILARKRTIPTERPPLVIEASANFRGQSGVASSAQRVCTVVNLGYLDRSRYICLFKQLFSCLHETGWTPFQTHNFTENLVAPSIEHGTSGSVVWNSDH